MKKGWIKGRVFGLLTLSIFFTSCADLADGLNGLDLNQLQDAKFDAGAGVTGVGSGGFGGGDNNILASNSTFSLVEAIDVTGQNRVREKRVTDCDQAIEDFQQGLFEMEVEPEKKGNLFMTEACQIQIQQEGSEVSAVGFDDSRKTVYFRSGDTRRFQPIKLGEYEFLIIFKNGIAEFYVRASFASEREFFRNQILDQINTLAFYVSDRVYLYVEWKSGAKELSSMSHDLRTTFMEPTEVPNHAVMNKLYNTNWKFNLYLEDSSFIDEDGETNFPFLGIEF
jgi:hypothetical protein